MKKLGIIVCITYLFLFWGCKQNLSGEHKSRIKTYSATSDVKTNESQ